MSWNIDTDLYPGPFSESMSGVDASSNYFTIAGQLAGPEYEGPMFSDNSYLRYIIDGQTFVNSKYSIGCEIKNIFGQVLGFLASHETQKDPFSFIIRVRIASGA